VSLYKAETRRLVKRRFTKILLLGALIVLGAIAVGMFVVNQKVGPAQIASAEKKADAEFQQQTQIAGQQKQQCQAAKGTPDAGNWPANCDDITPPTRDNFQTQWYLPATFNLREDFGAMVTTLAGVLALAAFVVGASFVGAEWNSGGMMNLLLWRPQRLKVLNTKLTALLAGIFGFAVLTAVVWTGIFALIAKYRGTTAKMTSGVWQSFGLMEVRALVLVLVAAAVGFGLASIGRHTAVAFGIAIGVAVLLQIGLVTVLELAKVKFAELYLIPIWLQAWLQQSVKLQDYNSCNFSVNNSCEPDSMTLTWHHAGLAMAIILVVVVGGAMWTIRRRDIT
jgi:ABC-type transport system involved in multi-copper enzyme maturation permease subunit